MALRVLVADDSSVFRRAITDALTTIPDVQVVGSASNGRIAVQKVLDLKPDLLTLDMEMPEMDGLSVLQALKQAGSATSVMVISSVTMRGGRLTMQALERGAFDFLTKPQGKDAAESKAMMIRELSPRLRALAHRRQIHDILRTAGSAPGSGIASAVAPLIPATPPPPTTSTRSPPSRLGPPGLVLIGVSTGGPAALARVLPFLPADLGVPIAIVQHMPPIFTQSLAESLSSRCSLQVREAADGDKLVAGQVLIAPGGRQMRLVAAPDAVARVQITDDPPENNCRPAVDYLFRSAAMNLPGRAMAVILTGMGCDGTLGLRLLKRHGCFTIAQDEATSVVFGMPKAAIDAGLADVVLPVDAVAARILSFVKGRGS